ncbi:MAG: NUDIX domain-containing protein [Pseudonocardiaceae bacterium]|nr:NUDIX domain-containing protein [Pseudonocardiaceae bacterium]
MLWRQRPGGVVEVALVHRPRYDDWSLPKGKLDAGETSAAAATREAREETGFRAILGRKLGQVSYSVPASGTHSLPKTVQYFSARALEGTFRPNDEVDELCWIEPDRARARVSYPHDSDIIAEFAAQPADSRTVLLVRHAKAGKRQDWSGDDDLRPLSAAGMEQAAALRTLLPLFGPDKVFSAPRLRCVQTVQGVAEDLGITVQTEPLLAEDSYWKDSRGALGRLQEIVDGSGTPVVCSQGGVIPDLVTGLAERDDVSMGRIIAKKASVWVLSFLPAQRGGQERLIAADYIPSPLAVPAS